MVIVVLIINISIMIAINVKALQLMVHLVVSKAKEIIVMYVHQIVLKQLMIKLLLKVILRVMENVAKMDTFLMKQNKLV